MDLREAIQRFIDCQQLIVGLGRGNVQILERDALLASSMPLGLLAARSIYQDPPHGFRRRRKKMTAAFEADIRIAREADPRFMHQRGGLQGLPRRFMRHFGGRELPQFVINQGQQLLRCFPISALRRFQDLCYFADKTSISILSGTRPVPDPINCLVGSAVIFFVPSHRIKAVIAVFRWFIDRRLSCD